MEQAVYYSGRFSLTGCGSEKHFETRDFPWLKWDISAVGDGAAATLAPWRWESEANGKQEPVRQRGTICQNHMCHVFLFFFFFFIANFQTGEVFSATCGWYKGATDTPGSTNALSTSWDDLPTQTSSRVEFHWTVAPMSRWAPLLLAVRRVANTDVAWTSPECKVRYVSSKYGENSLQLTCWLVKLVKHELESWQWLIAYPRISPER